MDLTPELLRPLLRYDPITGKLFWFSRPVSMFGGRTPRRAASAWNSRYAGKEALAAVDKNGYRVGAVLGRTVKAHRVAWVLHTEAAIPKGFDLDHANGVRTDNRALNLRLATRSQNSANSPARKIGHFKGTAKHSLNTWAASIRAHGKRIYLGSFPSEKEAHEAYILAASEHYGEYAYHNREHGHDD